MENLYGPVARPCYKNERTWPRPLLPTNGQLTIVVVVVHDHRNFVLVGDFVDSVGQNGRTDGEPGHLHSSRTHTQNKLGKTRYGEWEVSGSYLGSVKI